MISNTPCTPYYDGNEDAFFVKRESWEGYLNTEAESSFTLHSIAPPELEILFEKPLEKMEEDFIPYNEDSSDFTFPEDFGFLKEENMRGNEVFNPAVEYTDALYRNEGSECSRCNTEDEQEDVSSISTKDSNFAGFVNDSASFAEDDNLFADTTFDLETQLSKKVMEFAEERTTEERCYIQKIFPVLVSSVKETLEKHQLPLSDQIIRSILKELLHGKEMMIGSERQVLRKLTQKEAEDIKRHRPDKMVTEDDLATHNRKEKKSTKGNRNSSNMNHLNENYVSNIFQFAKRNFPEDKEIQRIGNERNVSASNFKKLVGARITDDIMLRKAKARIIESGRELVGNIEYWMKDGYFDQCADREKYIYHKEKALRDLALTGNY